MFSIIKRHLTAVILGTAIFSLIVWLVINNFSGQYNSKTTFLITVSAKEKAKNEEAHFFTETIRGWFKNPVFLERIYRKAGSKMNITSYRQERQNLIIEVNGAQAEKTENFARKAFDVLGEKIEEYNNLTGKKFLLLDQGMSTIDRSFDVKMLTAVFSLLAGFLIIFTVISVTEKLRGKILTISMLNEIFALGEVIPVKKGIYSDMEFINALIEKTGQKIIIGETDESNGRYAVAIAENIAGRKKVLLVDADLKNRRLHNVLGISRLIKNFRGFTDWTQKEIKDPLKYIFPAKNKNFLFLPAGNGETFRDNVFSFTPNSVKTIIYTSFPGNFNILSLNDISLFLIVKLGKTKEKTLRRLANIWKDKVLVFVI